MRTDRPPFALAEYSPSRDQMTLLLPDERCVARWIITVPGMCNARRSDPCGGKVSGVIGGAALCLTHVRQACSWRDEEVRRMAAEAREAQVAADLKESRAREEREQRAAGERVRVASAERAFLKDSWAADGPSIVYYLRRRSDGIVKIGTTKRRAIRFGDLAKEHGELDLLLSHAGDLEREHRIHAQFGYLRVQGEWFRPEHELMRWIRAGRSQPENAAAPIKGTVSPSYLRKMRPMVPMARVPGPFPCAGMLTAGNPRIKSRRDSVGESDDA